MSDHPVIGPRQTVDRAKHPTLGEGRAVYDNGDAWFIPDEGEPVRMKWIGLGGASSNPRRSYKCAETLSGEQIDLETTDRAHGDRHHRRWHPIHGDGWMVGIGGSSWTKGGPTERWEGDNGTVIPMRVECMKVGKPEDWNGRRGIDGNRKKSRPAEHEHWITYEIDGGETFVFRRASPEVLPIAEGMVDEKKTANRLQDAAASTAPRKAPAAPIPSPPSSGLRWPPPDATREEIAAFYRQHGAA